MDVRLGRSKNQFIQIILPSIHNEQDESGLPSSAYLPSSINFKCGRSINRIIQIIQILDIFVDKEYWNALLPNSMKLKFGRSIHHHYHLQSLPSMTKEEKQKL